MKTILFDLDGTLMDTAPDLAKTLNTLLAQYHYPTLPYEKIRPHASTGVRGLLHLGFGIDEKHPRFDQLRKEFLNVYDACLTDNTQLFPGMLRVLDAIESNHLHWGVVTNKLASFSQKLLEHFNLAKRCACLVGIEMVQRPKPAPDSLLMACSLLKESPQQCMYVGDAERDMLAAKEAGMYAVGALYGYILEDEDPASWLADAYVRLPEDIVPIISAFP